MLPDFFERVKVLGNIEEAAHLTVYDFVSVFFSGL